MRNRKGTYTLTTTPNNYEDEATLKNTGFQQDFDSTPFYLTTNDRDEVNNAMDVLEEYEYHSPWTLEKK